MPRQTVINPRHTNPFIWCLAIICSLLTAVVIITGIVVFVGYIVIKPKVPQISVTSAQLDRIDYDQAGIFSVRVIIIIKAENDNAEAHASFYDTNLVLGFDTVKIAYLRATPFEVKKNSTLELRYEAESSPITLQPQEEQTLALELNKNVVNFDLEGVTRTRWRVGFIGSVKFKLHLSCRLQLPRTGDIVYPRCKTNAK